jgi:hypothetical protein
VDPRSGLVRLTRVGSDLKREERRRHEMGVTTCPRVLDENTLLPNLQSAWLRVDIAPLPTTVVSGRTEARFDVILGRFTAFGPDVNGGRRRHLYGSEKQFAVSTRQRGKREPKTCGLKQ